MADQSVESTSKNEPVNLLYLATTKGTDCDEIRQHEQGTNSAAKSVPVDPSREDRSSTDIRSVNKLHNEKIPKRECLTGVQRKMSSTRADCSMGRQDRETIRLECPRVSCPEKIIICLDISSEMEKPTFRSRVGDKFSPMQLVKRALGLFMLSKHRINNKHEFALIFLQDAAFWICDFTSNPSKIITILDDLSSCSPTENFDLSSVFDLVQQNIHLPTVTTPLVMPPPYVVRTIILYGRSNCIPSMEDNQSLKLLFNSAYFFLDAFYIHEPPSDGNQCEAIFDKFCDLDVKGLSYISEVSRNPTKLYDGMAQLLPHPLQRPLQTDVMFSVEEVSQTKPTAIS